MHACESTHTPFTWPRAQRGASGACSSTLHPSGVPSPRALLPQVFLWKYHLRSFAYVIQGHGSTEMKNTTLWILQPADWLGFPKDFLREQNLYYKPKHFLKVLFALCSKQNLSCFGTEKWKSCSRCRRGKWQSTQLITPYEMGCSTRKKPCHPLLVYSREVKKKICSNESDELSAVSYEPLHLSSDPRGNGLRVWLRRFLRICGFYHVASGSGPCLII